jgi:hypothetical protein
VSCSFFGPKVTVIVPPLSRDPKPCDSSLSRDPKPCDSSLSRDPKPCDSSLGGDSCRVDVACFRRGETGDVPLGDTCCCCSGGAASTRATLRSFPELCLPTERDQVQGGKPQAIYAKFPSKFCDSIDAIMRSCNLPWQDVEDMKVFCNDKGLVCGPGLCWPTMGSSCMSRNLARTLARSLKSDLWWRGFPCQWGCQMRGIRRRFHVQGCAPHR